MNFKIIFTGLLQKFLSLFYNIKKYDNIITEIKKQDLPFEKLEKYKIENFSNPATIKTLADNYTPERGKGKGLIWVFKTKENLLVFIETKDYGHAGEYGMAYSENGQTPTWRHDEWGLFWSTGRKVNNRWWKIYFDLD